MLDLVSDHSDRLEQVELVEDGFELLEVGVVDEEGSQFRDGLPVLFVHGGFPGAMVPPGSGGKGVGL